MAPVLTTAAVLAALALCASAQLLGGASGDVSGEGSGNGGGVFVSGEASVRDEACATGDADSELACEWSPTACTGCPDSCNLNQALLDFDDSTMDSLPQVEQLSVCMFAGQLQLMAELQAAFGGGVNFRGLEEVAAASGFKPVVGSPLSAAHLPWALGKVSVAAASRAAPHRALQQTTGLSLACPDAATIRAGSDAYLGGDAGVSPLGLSFNFTSAAQFEAYVAANCSTVTIPEEIAASIVASMGDAGGAGAASLEGGIEICADRGNFLQGFFELNAGACAASAVANIGDDGCFGDAEDASRFLTPECFAGMAELVGASRAPAAAFANAAIAVQNNCAARTTQAACGDAQQDAEIQDEVQTMRQSRTEVIASFQEARDNGAGPVRAVLGLLGPVVALAAYALM